MPQYIACRHPKLFVLDFRSAEGLESHLTFLALLRMYCPTRSAAAGVSCCIENGSEVVKANTEMICTCMTTQRIILE